VRVSGEKGIVAVRVLVGQGVFVTSTGVERVGVEVSGGGNGVCVGNSSRFGGVGLEIGVRVAAGLDKSQMPPIAARINARKRPTPSNKKMNGNQRLRGARWRTWLI
jgi:hypothetical protein